MVAPRSRNHETNCQYFPTLFLSLAGTRLPRRHPPNSVPQEFLERSLWQGHEKPPLEHQECQDRQDSANRNGTGPRILAQPFHKGEDQKRGGNVDSDVGDDRNINCRRQNDCEDLLELVPPGKQIASIRACEYFCKIDGGGDDHSQADIKRKKAGLRPVCTPTDADPHATVNSNKREQRHKCRYPNLDTPAGRTRPTGLSS